VLSSAVLVWCVRIALAAALHEIGFSGDLVFRAVSDLTFWIVVAELLCLLPAMVILSIVLTHRVVGPIDRMLAALEQLARGDYEVRLMLRRRDALGALAEAINRLAASLRRGRG
jgi:nitrogen fixation/metabolism regulation signal transduction histidine kinase